MSTDIAISKKDKQIQTDAWFTELRNIICQEFENIEQEAVGDSAIGAKFEKKKWDRSGGGGGEMSIMRGEVFEKVGVNISTVHGQFSDEFRAQIPGTEDSAEFFACGVSLVSHMKSPLVPAIHMNTRFIATGKTWFGGGIDLTPTIPNPGDYEFFHSKLKAACDRHDVSYYPKYSKICDEYFYLKHRKEPRGIGGIFFDYLNSGDDLFDEDFSFVKDVGKAFVEIYPAIVRKHMSTPWTEEQKEQQLIKRGRYVEFNLIYDRGTKFGLMTDGNPEAILMSMPPCAKWP